MRPRELTLGIVVLSFAALFLLGGCAGTGGDSAPDNPRLIHKELEKIETDIGNAEEMLKGHRAQLQVDDNQTLRNEIRRIEMDLYKLRARKAALNERLRELEVEQTEGTTD